MTIRHLKIFITVAECGKMRKAAELLYISQPSVSQAIQELENYYGVKLFDRISQKLYLTEIGEKLLPYARNAVETVEDTDLFMKNAGSYSRLRIGASVSIGTYFINDVIDALEKELTNIDTHVVINNTSAIEDKILSSKIDVGIVEGKIIGKDMIKLPLFKDELVVIVGKKHPYYNREYIELSDLDNQVLIAREMGSMDRNHYEEFLLENKISMQKKWSCTNTEAIKNAVIHGRGIGIMSNFMIKDELAEGTLKILPVENVKIERDMLLIYHKDKFISQPLQQFIDICLSLSKASALN